MPELTTLVRPALGKWAMPSCRDRLARRIALAMVVR
jgi:hypothetical protein